MSELHFNKNHSRVIRSSVNAHINSTVVGTVYAFGVLGCLLSIVFLIFGMTYAWFLAAVSVLPVMFYLWYSADVKNIPVKVNAKLPEELLSVDLLSKLKTSPITTDNIIEACLKTDGFLFFARRFHINEELLKQTSDVPSEAWWGLAQQLWHDIPDEDGIDASYVVVALILSSSNKQKILSSASTNEKDIVQGLSWLVYWKQMFRTVHSRKATGGIARDWATGYTPMLNRFAYNISKDIQFGGSYHRDVFGHRSIVTQMHSVFTQSGRNNIMLVGAQGVGKTTCVEAFADTLLFETPSSSPLRFNQLYRVDTAAMLTQMNSQNLLENAVASMAVEAKKAKNIILYFPDVANLFGIEGGIDISNTMLPIVQNGTFRIIFSSTEGQWKWLQQHKPQLASLMNFQAVGAPGIDDAMRILENKAITTEHQYSCLFTYNALKDVYRLASRYGPDLAMPAQAISVMDMVARIYANNLITPAEVSSAIEQTTGVKTGTASSSEKSALLGLEAELHQRVIGQNEAITTVVSALQRSRAGVANQNKPIGTFLFLGPTGVGKTETAKAVASAYFGGEDRLIRVDMNQYITQESVRSLLESGSTQSSTLLDSVKKQPFSVILFDEIEKAHPDVINTLLQMLDEGVMRDTNNKSISFKDAVIIATSNAGAEHIESYQEKFQKDPQQAQKSFIQQLISNGLFKPEFVNRFDNVVMYQPLSAEQLERVVDILMLNINKTLANQQLTVILTPEARTWLARNGHDPLMGARPLRRLMQETVENTVSRKILEESVVSGSGATVILDVSDLEK